MENPSKETLEKWRKDPNNWKFGCFYHNKEDERVLVDKKNPNMGATLNFAKKQAYWFLIGFLGFLLLIFGTVFVMK
jgi:uncharacterized membrane protein